MTAPRFAPPALTPAQLATIEGHRIVELSRLLRAMLPATTIDDARREARATLRRSIASAAPGNARLKAATLCGQEATKMVATFLGTALVDARPVALLAEINRLVLRYVRLYGGEPLRALYRKAERQADARDAAAWN